MIGPLSRATRAGAATVALLAVVAGAGCASRGAPREAPALTLEGRQVAYDRGYSAGFGQGERDARDGRAFDVTRDSDYKNADQGYRRPFRNREAYREIYRQAYEAGYKRGYYGYGRGLADARRGQNPPAAAPPTLPGAGTPAPYPNYGADVAYDNGYRDGHERGMDDAYRNRPYEPGRREGLQVPARGYFREYGPRAQYDAAYRNGFRAGYDAGYRAVRR